MIIEESVYLEHYGTKGMRWGVRRSARNDVRTAGSSGRKTGQRVKRDKKKSRFTTEEKVAIGIVGGVVALRVTSAILNKAANVQMSKIATDPATKLGNARIQDYIKKNGRTVINIPPSGVRDITNVRKGARTATRLALNAGR